MLITAFSCSCAFIISLLLTRQYRVFAERLNVLDVPNERSSHQAPIPRGAGISFFFAFNVILGFLLWQEKITMEYAFPLMLGGSVVAALGYWDDVSSVSATLRLFIHFLVSIFIFSLLSQGFIKHVEISFLPDWPWLTAIFCILFIIWFINLYNFMDGCDGLSTSIGIAGAGLIAVVSLLQGNMNLALIYIVLAYALGGFLVFNWPPAKVFMGDSGAYFLGYVFGSLALISKIYYTSSLYVHLIIFGLFIVDATWTVLRRAIRGERLYVGHRMHAFQKLIARGWGHARVTSLYVLITVLWLFPMSLLCVYQHEKSFLFLVIAYVPIFIFVLFMGAGTPTEEKK